MKKAFLCALLSFSLVFAALAPAQASESQDGQTLFQRLFGKTSASQPTQPDDLPDFAIDFTQSVQFGSFTVYIPEDFSFNDNTIGFEYNGSLSDSCDAAVVFAYLQYNSDLYKNDTERNAVLKNTLPFNLMDSISASTEIPLANFSYDHVMVDGHSSVCIHSFDDNTLYEVLAVLNRREMLLIVMATDGDGREQGMRELSDGILAHVTAPELPTQSNDPSSASLTQDLGCFTITLPDGAMVYSDTANRFLLDDTVIQFLSLKEYGIHTLDTRINLCYQLAQSRYPGSRTKLLSTTPYITFRVRWQERCGTALILFYQEDLAIIEIVSSDYDDALDVADAILDSVVFSGEDDALAPPTVAEPMQELTFDGFTVMLPEEYAYNNQFGVYESQSTWIHFFDISPFGFNSENGLDDYYIFAELFYDNSDPQLIQTSSFIALMLKDTWSEHGVTLILGQGTDALLIDIYSNRLTPGAEADFERIARQILANTVYSATP